MNNTIGTMTPGMSPETMGNSNSGGGKLQQQTQSEKSFASVLDGKMSNESPDATQQVNAAEANGSNIAADALSSHSGTSGSRLSEIQAELMRKVDALPPGARKQMVMLPDFLELDSRMKMMGEAMKGVQGKQEAADLGGMFKKAESAWFNVETDMRSKKDLSQGELLGLQARMYQVSQYIEVMSKVVDQTTSGIKTVLNTNV